MRREGLQIFFNFLMVTNINNDKLFDIKDCFLFIKYAYFNNPT